MTIQFIIHQICLSIITPPFCFLPLLILAVCVMKKKKNVAMALIILSVLGIYALGTPYVSQKLISKIEQIPTFDWRNYQCDEAHTAIVVLAGGSYYDAPEYDGKNTVGDSTMRRLRYGAYLAKRLHVPVLVSGGNPYHDGDSIADAMADVLKNEYNINNIIIENKSDDTWQNAQFTWQMLNAQNRTSVVLVTDAWHMPRAESSFKKQGFKVIAAPTVYSTVSNRGWLDLLPNGSALRDSQYFFYEAGSSLRLWFRTI